MSGQTTETADLVVPTIHLNGTPRERLLAQLQEASQAVFQAIDKLAATSPNQRDYYSQPPEAWKAAVAQHSSRGQRLRSVMDELDEIANRIYG